jgi:hypothetical protein
LFHYDETHTHLNIPILLLVVTLVRKIREVRLLELTTKTYYFEHHSVLDFLL